MESTHGTISNTLLLLGLQDLLVQLDLADQLDLLELE
jgi:hypothetical protein